MINDNSNYDKEYQDKYRKENKEDIIEYKKEYRKNNKEKISKQKKIFYIKNKEKIILKTKEYRTENKEKISEYKKEYQKEKLSSNPEYRLRRYISKNIWRMLKINNSSKVGCSILNHLPYSLIELTKYIESLFEPWMNWSNQGLYEEKEWNNNNSSTWKWQLDHIIPQSDLPYTSMDDENFRKAWSLSNLRPLSAKQNLLDGVNKTRHIKGK
jgi:hypothetical protein